MDGYSSNDSPARESEESQGGASSQDTPNETKPTHPLPAPPSPNAKRRFVYASHAHINLFPDYMDIKFIFFSFAI